MTTKFSKTRRAKKIGLEIQRKRFGEHTELQRRPLLPMKNIKLRACKDMVKEWKEDSRRSMHNATKNLTPFFYENLGLQPCKYMLYKPKHLLGLHASTLYQTSSRKKPIWVKELVNCVNHLLKFSPIYKRMVEILTWISIGKACEDMSKYMHMFCLRFSIIFEL